ncbi:hypothetical protein DL95DRAFT_395538 [Leptodontidium sp. 2 PMI_412]|nr:hypothetical protein DL95DRAFT_395538 [Leptodontidium sp. 2 PMI_412]
MSRIPTSAIRFIKTLRFEFEPADWASFRIGGPGWGHWIDVIELLSEYANLSIMTLEIRLEDMIYTRNEEEGHLSIFDATLNKREYEVNMLNAYSNFLLPIAILKGRLKNFFVHLNWGTSVTGDGQALDGREVVERKLESLVMGEEYDAWKRGKVYRVYAWI